VSDDLRSGAIDLNLDDLRALARICVSRPARLARVLGLVLAVASVLTFIGSRLLRTPYAVSDFLWVLAPAAVLACLGSPEVRARLWRWQMRRNPLFVPQAYAIGQSELEVTSEKMRSAISWSMFPDVRRVDQWLFVFVTRDSAYIIPRRAFDRDDDFNAFADAAERCWRAHRQA